MWKCKKRIAWEVAEYQACAGISLQDSLTQIINANSQPGNKGLLENLSPKKMFQNEQQRDDLLTGRYNFNFLLKQIATMCCKNPLTLKLKTRPRRARSGPMCPISSAQTAKECRENICYSI